VSYETAAHRFTNLATHRLDVPVHFMRIASTGVIYKAYENDGVHFPTDATGAIEGQPGLPLLDGACSLRPARCVVGVPEVHRHHIGYVHRCGRPDSGGTVLRECRSAFTPR
jgi:XRE family transcriptional regulator, fatty acid utilization regulator